MTLIEDLPQEIMEEIFEFIDFKHLQTKAVLVCKTWFKIIRNSVRLSGKIEEFYCPRTQKDDWKSLKENKFQFYPEGKFEDLEYVLSPSWPALKVLTIADNTRNSHAFISTLSNSKELFKKFGNIEELRIAVPTQSEWCDEEDRSYYFEAKDTFKLFSDLFAMKMEDCPSEWTYETFIQASKPIRITFRQTNENALDFTGDTDFERILSNVKELCVAHLQFEEAFDFLIRQIPKLEKLRLYQVNSFLINKLLQNTAKIHANLKYLRIYRCHPEKLDFRGILKFQYLEKVDFEHVLFPKDFGTMKGTLKNLKSLRLHNCIPKKEAWNQMIRSMPNLTRLIIYLDVIQYFADMTMTTSEFLSPLKHLEKLKILLGIGILHKDEDKNRSIELVTKNVKVDCYAQLSHTDYARQPYEILIKPIGHIRPFFGEHKTIREKYPIPK